MKPLTTLMNSMLIFNLMSRKFMSLAEKMMCASGLSKNTYEEILKEYSQEHIAL
ncbi:MAG: hypothetical protein O3A80_03375 [bacterium]|nr:hypothetical protein [bacterium]MDA1292890.1 hypothetical protein [bacterium]